MPVTTYPIIGKHVSINKELNLQVLKELMLEHNKLEEQLIKNKLKNKQLKTK